ncbi:aldo/keto reductase [Ramlibacter sp. PS4R-6]|uniref:aldo/keto reductase n=1 Tax=Ramlibacter sp. PS4R-6 TaxID=3133438 RepID=UPI0030AFAF31
MLPSRASADPAQPAGIADPVRLKRGVFGTASLGSKCAPDIARQVLRQAIASGFHQFDTAPFYGAGHAERLLGELGDEGMRVSTKFGSPRPSRLRFMAVRVLRGRRPGDLVPPPALLVSRDGEFDCAAQRRPPAQLSASMAALSKCAQGFLFAHSPPRFPGAAAVSAWSDLARSSGYVLGVSGPRNEDMEAWLEVAPADACFQLHLDTLESLTDPVLDRLARRTVWIHGIFSPPTGAGPTHAADRQKLAHRWAADLAQAAFVVTSTRPEGVARAGAFVRELEG